MFYVVYNLCAPTYYSYTHEDINTPINIDENLFPGGLRSLIVKINRWAILLFKIKYSQYDDDLTFLDEHFVQVVLSSIYGGGIIFLHQV